MNRSSMKSKNNARNWNGDASVLLVKRINEASSPKKIVELMGQAFKDKLLKWGYPVCYDHDEDCGDHGIFSDIRVSPCIQVDMRKIEKTGDRPSPEYEFYFRNVVLVGGLIEEKSVTATARDYSTWEKANDLFKKFTTQAGQSFLKLY